MVSVAETNPDGRQQPARLGRVHGEVVDADLHDALGRHAAAPSAAAARPRVAIASCDPAGRCSASSATASRHSWLVTSSTWSRTSATGSVMADIAPTRRVTAVAAIAGAAKPARPEQLRVDRLDPVQRRRGVGQQGLGVVVPLVQRHPRGASSSLGPLGQQRRLAVARRSDDRRPPAPDGRRAADRPARPGTRSPGGPRDGGASTPGSVGPAGLPWTSAAPGSGQPAPNQSPTSERL